MYSLSSTWGWARFSWLNVGFYLGCLLWPWYGYAEKDCDSLTILSLFFCWQCNTLGSKFLWRPDLVLMGVRAVRLFTNLTELGTFFSDLGADDLTKESQGWPFKRGALVLGSWENHLELRWSVLHFSWKPVHIDLPVGTIFVILQLAPFPFTIWTKRALSSTSGGRRFSTLIRLCIMLLLLKRFHDPLPEVTRDFDELLSSFECVDSSVTAQVTHQYLRMVCCHTWTVLLNGSLFSAAALFLKNAFYRLQSGPPNDCFL